jgi:hypothetical protein
MVKQAGDKLFAVWVAYDPAGRATWFSVTPAGSADFVPQAVSRARFDFTIDGVAGSIPLERIRF